MGKGEQRELDEWSYLDWKFPTNNIEEKNTKNVYKYVQNVRTKLAIFKKGNHSNNPVIQANDQNNIGIMIVRIGYININTFKDNSSSPTGLHVDV